MAQLVEHNLAKVGAAGSSPVSRSELKEKDIPYGMSFSFNRAQPVPEKSHTETCSRSPLPLRSAQNRRPLDVVRRLACKRIRKL